MTILLQFIQTFIQNINLLLDELSKPNSKYIHHKVQYEITHMRYKALLTTKLVLVLVFMADTLISNVPPRAGLIRCGICLGLCAAMVISGRYHPSIFHVAYNLFCIAYGPHIMNTGENGIHRAWFLGLCMPIYQYVFIGNLKHFIMQVAVQMLYVYKFYNPIMERAITFMTPETFVKYLTYSTNLAMVFCMILICFAHYFMEHAFKRISVVEKKKDEIEKQKTFLLGFSHELRNLINSLTGNVKLASLEIVNSKAKELLLNAEVCGELLLHLVNNILDSGKVEIGELEINPVSTRVYETLERIWGVCSELIKRKNLNGKLRISRNLPQNLMIDHYRITQIFLNLVGNSVKFTERGLIDISVEWIARKESVDEKCFQPYPFNYFDGHDEGLFEKQKTWSNFDNNVITLNLQSRRMDLSSLKIPAQNADKGVLKIVISDTGCGMSEEETKRLFQKFTQVTSDYSKRKLGTGLGLFITKQLCQRMHGDIKVFSKKDHGSCFILCIPTDVVQEESSFYTHDIESLKKFVMSQNLKAMVVDDTSFNHTILKNFFDKIGIQVVDIASNGLEAYQKYSQLIERGEHLDIITMDIDMPVMDGKEAARKIRKLEAEKGIRSCFMPIISANCSESEIAECLTKYGEIKADRFIKKPATIEELLRVIGHHFLSLR